MKKKCLFLAAILLISGAIVAVTGIVVKYTILEPLGLCDGEPAVAIPFILLRDDGLKYVVTVMQDQPAEQEESRSAATEPTQEQIAETTQPTQPLPEKTLFIGDSRTCGLRDYARDADADYFCEVGMSVFNVHQQCLSDEAFDERTLAQVLHENIYRTVVISLGLNESGYPLESLMRAYGELLSEVSEAQPEARIVLQGVMTVGKSWAEKAPYAAPSNLEKINSRISEMVDGDRIIYIDPNTVFADGDGYLLEELSADGCHLYAKVTCQWAEWIRQELELSNT